MAENNGFVDFEAIADQAGVNAPVATTQPVPTTKKGHIDFEALADIPKAGSTLAKHRWSKAGMEKRGEPGYTMTGQTSPRLEKLRQAGVVDAIPTPQGLADINAINATERPETSSAMEYFGRELTPGPSFAGNVVKDVAGLGLGPLDMAQMGLRGKFGELGGMVKGAAEFGLKAPLATAGAIANDLVPQIGEFLHRYGLSREDFDRMFHDNPVGTIMAVVGGAEAARGIGRKSLGTPTPEEIQAQQGKNIQSVSEANAVESEAKAVEEARARIAKIQADQEAIRTGRAGVENDWRDRIETLGVQQRGAAEAATGTEAARQAALYKQSPAFIVDEKGRPKYVGSRATPPEGATQANIEAPGLEPYQASRSQEPGYTKAQVEHDLNTGAIENLDPNLPNEMLSWTMEGGFKVSRLMPNEGAEPGRVYTASEANIRQIQALQFLKENGPKALTPDEVKTRSGRVKKGRKGERGSLDPQVINDLYDLGAHFYGKAKTFAAWAAEMVKATGIKSAKVLKAVWGQISRAMEAGFNKLDKKLGVADYPPNETQAQQANRLFNNPPGRATPEDYARLGLTEPEAPKGPTLSRRDPLSQDRAMISEAVKDWNDRNTPLEEQHAQVKAMVQSGEIPSHLERAFLREISKVYGEKVAGPKVAEDLTKSYSPEAQADYGAWLEEGQKLEAARKAQQQGFSVGKLPDEPKGGQIVGSGIGGAQDIIEKTWSGTAALIERLPKVFKSEGLINALTKESGKAGVPFTKAERQALQLDEFVRQHPGQIDKEALKGWVADRVVTTEEKVLSNENEIYGHDMQGNPLEAYAGTYGTPKFNDLNLRLPGGDNYREVMVKAPQAYETTASGGMDLTVPSFRGGHFDPNTLAHMRLTDRQVHINGRPTSTLFAEEFQSDWNNAARKQVAQAGKSLLPHHPLLSEWKDLLFKRLLRKAAAEGKDAIAWTTGEQQAARYSLRKHVERVHLEPTAGGSPEYIFTGITKDGQVLVSKRISTLEQIQTLVGPDVAKKLMDGTKDGGASEVRGQELDIGGKWTTDLYDNQMVNIANKWAKRFGGRVERGTTQTGSIEPGTGAGYDTAFQPVHTLPLTPAMRASILFEGNPTFGWLTKEGYQQSIQELHAAWKKTGRTLGSGLGGLDPFLEPILKIGAYHTANIAKAGMSGTAAFAEWSVRMGKELKALGLPHTSDQLKTLWDGPEMSTLRATSGLDRTIHDATSRSIVPDVDLGPQHQEFTDHMAEIHPEGDGGLLSVRLGDIARQMSRELGVKLGMSPLDTTLMDARVRDLHAKFVRAAAARNYAETTLGFDIREIEKVYTAPDGKIDMPKLEEAGRFLNSEQVKAIKGRLAQERAAYQQILTKSGDLTKEQRKFKADYEANERSVPDVPELTPEEYTRITADPIHQAAFKLWSERIQPYVESFKESAGIKTTRTTDSGVYSRIVYQDLKTNLLTSPGSGGGPSIFSYARKKSRSAIKATGVTPEGKIVVNDPRLIMRSMYIDRINSAYYNEFRDAVKATAVADDAHTTVFGGKTVPTDKAHLMTFIDGKGNATVEVINVPEPVARAYKHLMADDPLRRNDGSLSLWGQWNQAATAAFILAPKEVVAHTFNIISAAAREKNVGYTLGPLGRIAANTPIIPRVAIMLAEAARLSGPAFEADVVGLSAALRTGHFAEGGQVHGLTALGDKIPGIKAMRNWGFGLPQTEALNPLLHPIKMTRGIETRLRVMLYRYMKLGDAKLTYEEAANYINGDLGTYVQKLNPPMVQALGTRLGDVFARAGTAMLRSGAKSVVGMGPRGFSAEVLLNTYAKVGTIIALTKMSTGKYPWQLGLKSGEIALNTDDGKRTIIPSNMTMNVENRFLRATGIKGAVDSYMMGETDWEQVGTEGVRSVVNYWAGRVGPGAGTTFEMATNRAHYFDKNWNLPHAVPPTNHPFVDRAKAATKTLAVVPTDLGEMYNKGEEVTPGNPTLRYAQNAANFVGFRVRTEGPEMEARAAGGPARGRYIRMMDIVDGISAEMWGHKDILKWGLEQIKKRVDKDQQVTATRELFGKFKARPKGTARSAIQQQNYLNQQSNAPTP